MDPWEIDQVARQCGHRYTESTSRLHSMSYNYPWSISCAPMRDVRPFCSAIFAGKDGSNQQRERRNQSRCRRVERRRTRWLVDPTRGAAEHDFINKPDTRSPDQIFFVNWSSSSFNLVRAFASMETVYSRCHVGSNTKDGNMEI